MIKQSKYKYFKLQKIKLNIYYFKFHVSNHQAIIIYIYSNHYIYIEYSHNRYNRLHIYFSFSIKLDKSDIYIFFQFKILLFFFIVIFACVKQPTVLENVTISDQVCDLTMAFNLFHDMYTLQL